MLARFERGNHLRAMEVVARQDEDSVSLRVAQCFLHGCRTERKSGRLPKSARREPMCADYAPQLNIGQTFDGRNQRRTGEKTCTNHTDASSTFLQWPCSDRRVIDSTGQLSVGGIP